METLTFPTLGSPRSFAFSHAYYDYSENVSTASTPFVSAPSSPGRNGFYFSAPASPNWAARTEMEDSSSYTRREFASAVPFSWEEKPGTPKRRSEANEGEKQNSFLMTGGSDFEFSARFSEMEDPPMSPTPMSSANELFFNGQIRPLKPPPRLQQPFSVRQLMTEEALSQGNSFADQSSPASCSLSAPQSPRSPLKSGQRSLVKAALCGISSPVDQVLDPFAVAMDEMAKRDTGSGHRRTRSLSPLRIFHWDEHSSKSSSHEEFLSRDSSVDEKEQRDDSRRSSPKTSKRWTLKDLLHRRSGGDGKSNSRGGLRRSSEASPSPRDQKLSLRSSGRSEGSQSSIDSSPRDETSKTKASAGPVNGATLRMKGPQRSPRGSLSPHELHYTTQRAQTEELRKKTFLPYRQGLLGCLGFTSKSYRAVSTISKTLQPVS